MNAPGRSKYIVSSTTLLCVGLDEEGGFFWTTDEMGGWLFEGASLTISGQGGRDGEPKMEQSEMLLGSG